MKGGNRFFQSVLVKGLFVIVFLCIVSQSKIVIAQQGPDEGQLPLLSVSTDMSEEALPGQLIIKYEANSTYAADSKYSKSAQDYVMTSEGVTQVDIEYVLPKQRIALVAFDSGLSLDEMAQNFENMPDVAYAEPNYPRHTMALSINDSYAGLLRALNNTGQSVNSTTGTNDADIDAPEAWLISTGATYTVIVAVIDGGVAYNHPDLSGRMRDGTNCVSSSNTALGGCLHGYDFAQGDKDPLPLDFHGTHVAGTIAAEANNSTGIAGVAYNAKIMAVRMAFTTLSAAEATYFALYNGAKVINASYGGNSFSQTEYDAIQAFTQSGGLFVASAGNDTADNDSTPTYPASYAATGIIAVAATTQSDALASFSNYGVTSVDLGAPGTNIVSSYLSSSTPYSETFQGVSTPALPTGYVVSGASEQWITKSISSSIRLATTSGATYTGSVNTTVQTSGFTLSGLNNARIEFDTLCDTDTGVLQDYVTLSIATGSNTFSGLLSRDEFYYTNSNYFSFDVISSSYYHFYIDLPQTYVRNDLQLKLTRQTNATSNNFSGCWIDNLQIIGYADGSANAYGYLNGTSMAAPHVAGAAALLRGTRSDLTPAQVKAALLNYGDLIPALDNVTVSERRLNLNSSLLSVYDIVPDAFSFTSRTGVATNTLVTGSTVITGLTYQAAVTVSGGVFGTGGAARLTTGFVTNGTTMILYLTSANSYLTSTVMDVTIGGVTGSFTVTTNATEIFDTTPDSFSFDSVTGSEISVVQTSNTITILGINTGVDVSVSAGEYSLNSADYTSDAGRATSGDTISVRLTASASYSSIRNMILTIGGTTGAFSVTTKPSAGGSSGGGSSGGGGGGGGGGAAPTPTDTCPDGDHSDSIYDGKCNETTTTSTGTTSTGTQTTPPVAPTPTPSPSEFEAGDPTPLRPSNKTAVTYDQETKDAYSYAREHDITTRDSLEAAAPFGPLYRRDAAKMMVNFAHSIGKKTIIHDDCGFTDVAHVESDLQNYIFQACGLGLMGLRADGSAAETFRPDDTLTRAEFGTMLSRMLRGTQYNSPDPNAADRYAGHLQALKNNGIMNDIAHPEAIERRVYARIIFMRISP